MEEGTHRAATACLDERAAEVAALVHLAEAADREIVLRASAVAARLAAPSQCADASWLAHRPAPALGSEHEITALRRRLEQAAALRWAGRYDDGLALAKSITVDARTLGWPRLEAEALLLEGSLMEDSGDYEGSLPVLEAALFVSAKAGQDLLAAEAAEQLTFVEGSLLRRPDDGLHWARFGDLLLSRSGEVEGLGAAGLANVTGGVHQARGDFRDAISACTRAVEIYERELGPGHIELTAPLGGLGVAHMSLGEYAAARVHGSTTCASRCWGRNIRVSARR